MVFTIKSSSEDMMDVYNMEEIIYRLEQFLACWKKCFICNTS